MGILPQVGTAVSPVGMAIRASPGSEAAQEQESPLALVPSTSDSGSAGTATSADNAIAADYDPDYDHEYMAPSQGTAPVAIDPQAVDRINLAAAVKAALGLRLRLGI